MGQLEPGSSGTEIGQEPRFRIAIIGSGPIGKLLACCTAPHPRIQIIQYEAEVLPLRPSFGYGVGPQTLHAAKVLHPELGRRLEEQCYTSPVWMHWWHGGDEDRLLADVKVQQDRVFGRLGRQELMQLLDEFLPKGINGRQTGLKKEDIRYGMRLMDVQKTGPHELELSFENGLRETVNAVWAADGVNSLCRKLVQSTSYRPPSYTGFRAYRGKIEAKKTAELLGPEFSRESYMFIGVKGWHVLIFPIDDNKNTNVAAFCLEPERKRPGREAKVTLEELLSYFPGRNAKVDALLKIMQSDTPGGCQRLEITHMERLETFFNPDLLITTFGDAANATTPHIAGSMSCGFIGCTTFLRDEWNSRIESGLLAAEASVEEIAAALAEASQAYVEKHLPLAQKLVDISAEQGPLWSGGVIDVETLRERPLFLWGAADDKH